MSQFRLSTDRGPVPLLLEGEWVGMPKFRTEKKKDTIRNWTRALPCMGKVWPAASLGVALLPLAVWEVLRMKHYPFSLAFHFSEDSTSHSSVATLSHSGSHSM